MPDNFAPIFEKKLIRQIMAHDRAISAMFDELTRSVTPLLARYKMPPSLTDVWIMNKEIESALQTELYKFQARLKNYIVNETKLAWNLSADKTDALVNQFINVGAVSSHISQVAKEGLFVRHLDVLKEFQERRVAGMDLSQRVWKICQESKEQLELYLQSGLASGKSAAEIARDVKKYLKNPDARFRRIRNEQGKLILSKPMANYHPGQGVYRSAYKNALRVSRTETNMAYRLADHHRWKDLDFITGFEVKLSGSHPRPDICDHMAGKYPKSFVFTGWHSNCYCYCTTVMMSDDDFIEYLNTGKIPEQYNVKGIPPTAMNYMKVKSGAFGAMKNKPYWLKDNFKDRKGVYYPKSGVEKPPKIEGPIVKNNLPDPHRLIEDIEKRIRFNKLESAHAFNSEGVKVLTKQGDKRSVAVIEAFPGQLKDAIFTHNHPSGTAFNIGDIRRIGSSFSPQDIFIALRYNLSEIRAVTPRMTFTMVRPVGGWPTKEALKIAYLNETQKVSEILTAYINHRGRDIDFQRANAVHYHWVWKRVAKELGLIYSKVGLPKEIV